MHKPPTFMLDSSLGPVQLSSWSPEQMTFRFGRKTAAGITDNFGLPAFPVNGVEIEGYITVKSGASCKPPRDEGSWYYEGGSVYRSNDYMAPATDNARHKMWALATEELPGLVTDEMRAAFRLYRARTELDRANGAVEAANAAVVEANRHAGECERELHAAEDEALRLGLDVEDSAA